MPGCSLGHRCLIEETQTNDEQRLHQVGLGLRAGPRSNSETMRVNGHSPRSVAGHGTANLTPPAASPRSIDLQVQLT